VGERRKNVVRSIKRKEKPIANGVQSFNILDFAV